MYIDEMKMIFFTYIIAWIYQYLLNVWSGCIAAYTRILSLFHITYFQEYSVLKIDDKLLDISLRHVFFPNDYSTCSRMTLISY